MTEPAGGDLATARPQRPTDPSCIAWAQLPLRVCREGMPHCLCGGGRVVLAFLTERKIVKEFLAHPSLPTTVRPLGPPGLPGKRRRLLQDDQTVAPNAALTPAAQTVLISAHSPPHQATACLPAGTHSASPRFAANRGGGLC